jgi:hypothetical protein
MLSGREVLEAALKDVQDAGIPDDLRPVALWKAIDLRAGIRAVAPAAAGSPATARGGSAPHLAAAMPDAEATPGDVLASIGQRLGLDRATVEEVFTVQGGEPELIVPVGKLPAKVAAATKEIAVLMAGGRQAAGVEEWTSWDIIRAVCVDYKRIDSPNFAKTIREMGDVFNFRKDSQRKLSVKLSRPGWDRLTEAVRRLGGE